MVLKYLMGNSKQDHKHVLFQAWTIEKENVAS